MDSTSSARYPNAFRHLRLGIRVLRVPNIRPSIRGREASRGDEEVAHVRFATRWFGRWTRDDPEAEPEFRRWMAELPPPLTPTVLRGRPLDRARRERAGQRARFLDELDAWDPSRSS